MVNGVLKFLNKEIGGLHQAAYLLGLFAFFSQVLALVRDRLLAASFGAGASLDIYYAAFRIPDFIFVTVASVVSISVLIPALIERTAIDKKTARRFLTEVFTFFFSAIIVAAGIAFFLMPYIAPLVFPGFSDEAVAQTILLSRILLLSPILLGISNVLGSITQTFRRFFIYALSPLLYNFGIILGILFLSPSLGIVGVVYGVITGALFHLLIQLPFVIRSGLLPGISFSSRWSNVRPVLLISIPRTLTLAMSHLSILILLSFASLMDKGSISVYNFSSNLQSVPISIIGVSYSLAAFPTLSKLFSSGNQKKFLEQISTSARHVVFWSVPIAVLFIVLRAQIVRVILGSGQFDWTATRLTAAALALFAFSLVFQNIVLLYVRGFYSAGRTKAPLIISLFSSVVTIASVYFLISFFNHVAMFRYWVESLFRVSDIAGTSVLMLPLGFSVGQVVNGLLLLYFFKTNFKGNLGPLFKTVSHTFAASIIMGGVIWFFLNVFDKIFDINTFFGVFFQGFLSGIIGIAVALTILVLLGTEELRDIARTLHRRFWKTPIIGPDPDIV